MNTISAELPQKIIVRLLYTKGYQEDLFRPKDYSQRDVDTPEKWSIHQVIENQTNGVRLVLNPGVLNYIRQFGFYEGGGEENPYRVDPIKVVALLTGKSLS